jgi:predicted amidohydrolase
MKICLAQVESENGDVQRNVEHHMTVLRTLEPDSADLVVFPELSLSNYAPDVASSVAVEPTDARLDVFQRFASETGTTLAVGAPLRTRAKPLIAMVVFAPERAPVVVGKRHLHADEVPYFSPSEGGADVLDLALPIGVAICYEVSVSEHTESLIAGGAALYLASVAKTPVGVTKTQTLLSETARKYGIPALMVNSVGTCDGKPSGGGSMAMDRSGRLLAQLEDSAEGLLIYDADARTAVAIPVEPGKSPMAFPPAR